MTGIVMIIRLIILMAIIGSSKYALKEAALEWFAVQLNHHMD